MKKQLEESPYVPIKANGKHYELSQLYDDQAWIAYQVLSKIKEWFECTSFEDFKPLRCTVNGGGGVGKSVLINTLASVVRRFTNVQDSVIVTAPTGTAAFNVNGETLHSVTGQGINNNDFDVDCLSQTKREHLLKRFKSCLLLIVDERSMLTSELLGRAELTIQSVAYEGAQIQDTTFGGIPVVLIAGDDYQLSGITEGAHECTISHPHTKKYTKKPLIRGRQLFRELAHTVFELPKARRIKRITAEIKRS